MLPSLLPQFAGAVVVSPQNDILCQLRDNKPEIQFSGYWTCSPGGHVESGENPNEAIIRELREEFEIEVSNLKKLVVISESQKEIAGTYHAFTANLASPLNQLKCNEGQKACFYPSEEVMELRLHPVSLKIFQEYLAQNEPS
tara:strand:- start:160 stop:585 length:426 start_codon:yes stop_codon:yes gene_type:complete